MADPKHPLVMILSMEEDLIQIKSSNNTQRQSLALAGDAVDEIHGLLVAGGGVCYYLLLIELFLVLLNNILYFSSRALRLLGHFGHYLLHLLQGEGGLNRFAIHQRYLLALLLHQLAHELVGDQCEDQEESQHLEYVGGVPVPEDAEADCEYLAGGNDEGSEVLLELLDHPVDEHLSEGAKDAHERHVEGEVRVLQHEGEDVSDFQQHGGVDDADDGHPLVDLSHHLHGLGLVDRLDLGLEVWQEAVSEEGDDEEHNAHYFCLLLLLLGGGVEGLEHDDANGDEHSDDDLLGGEGELLVLDAGAKDADEDDGDEVAGLKHHDHWEVGHVDGVGVGEGRDGDGDRADSRIFIGDVSALAGLDVEVVDNGADDPGHAAGEDEEARGPGELLDGAGAVVGEAVLEPCQQHRYMDQCTTPVTRQVTQMPSTPEASCQNRVGSTQLEILIYC